MPRSKKSNGPHLDIAQWKKDNSVAAFLNANQDLPRLINGIVIEFAVRMEGEGVSHRRMIYVRCNLPHGVSALAIKQASTVLQQWSERLDRFQGLSEDKGYNAIYADLERLKQSGKSYGSIAKHLNGLIASTVTEFLLTHNQEFFSGRSAMDVMLAMGLSDMEIEQWFDAINENLKKGNSPFYPPDDVPITRDMIISRLKAFKVKRDTYPSPMAKIV